MFFCKFWTIFQNIFSFGRSPPDDCFFCLSVNFEETFFRIFLLQSTSAKLLFYVQVSEFQPTDTVKNYFTGAFQAFYTGLRSSNSKTLIYLNFLETVCQEVNLLLSCEMPTCHFTKKDSFTHPPPCTFPSLFQNTSRLLLPKRL